MTRLLVLGNSHSGALRMAKDGFAQRHPDVETAFFAAPGAQFLRGRTGPDGIWRPFMANDDQRATVMAINGSDACDLSGFDAILVVGYRFPPSILAEILLEHEVMGLPFRDAGSPARRLSRGFVEKTADAVIEAAAQQIERRIGTAHPFILTDAPYPSDKVGTRGDEVGRVMASLQTHPAAAELIALWTERVAKAVTARGWGFLPQPEHTFSGPAATRAEYAEAPAHGDGTTSSLVDHRHMNADFGMAILEAWAATRAATKPVAAAASA